MTQHLYNVITQAVIQSFPGGYWVDGQPGPAEPPLALLTEHVSEPPPVLPGHVLVQTVTADVAARLMRVTWETRAMTADEIAALSRKVWPTVQEYMAEYELPELAAISLSQDPTIAALRLLLSTWLGEVWSDDPRVIQGLDAIQAAGILTPERRAEICGPTNE